jgi:hypothetical protein
MAHKDSLRKLDIELLWQHLMDARTSKDDQLTVLREHSEAVRSAVVERIRTRVLRSKWADDAVIETADVLKILDEETAVDAP